jgi:hypothetical protein
LSRPLLTRLAFGLLTAAVWSAVPSAAEAQNVRVSLVTILASDQHCDVDPRLACVAKAVQKHHPHLTGFRMGQTACKSLPVGSRESFCLGDDGCRAAVEITHGPDKDNWVGLKLKPPRMGEVTYEVVCGKYFPILTRCQTPDKERILLAVMVRPCHQGK